MIKNIVLHRVGNKINQDDLCLSDKEIELSEEMRELLTNFFLNATAKQEETYQFYSEGALKYNAVYEYVSNIFEELPFIHNSQGIAKHLYEVVENPRIQGGDLFVVKFQTEEIESVGIFKVERKETFLKLKTGENSEIETDTGASTTRIDKAVIIYNIEKGNGYLVKGVDNNKRGDVFYWFEDFLGVRERKDEFFHTRETMRVFSEFVKKEMPQQYEMNQADQADLLNKSLTYFKENDVFNTDDFAKEVLGDDDLIESFENFQSDYEQETQTSIPEEFSVNPTAVKKSQKHFKSVIKLDKNFHLYIHGDRKKIEQGEDKKGKFYKLYYENEE